MYSNISGGLDHESFGRMLQVPATGIFNSMSRRMMAQMTAQKHQGPQWHSRILAEVFGNKSSSVHEPAAGVKTVQGGVAKYILQY